MNETRYGLVGATEEAKCLPILMYYHGVLPQHGRKHNEKMNKSFQWSCYRIKKQEFIIIFEWMNLFTKN
jgi:hypothetical protein